MSSLTSSLLNFFGARVPSGQTDGLTKTYYDYSIDELKAMTILERLSIRDWNVEIFTLLITLGLVLIWKIGLTYNESKVKKWLTKHEQVFKDQFYQFGTSSNEIYIKDSAEDFASYATGRLNISHLNINFNLEPRHNMFFYIMEVIFSFFVKAITKPEDKIELRITLDKFANDKIDECIWAIVNKEQMNKYRESNYYISLTKTSDSELLPREFVFMSEVPDLNEALFTKDLKDSIQNSGKILRFLAITDQPNDKPTKIQDTRPFKRFILQLNFPSSEEEYENSKKLVNSFITLVDHAVKKEFKPETIKKILKTREVEINKLKKIDEDLKKEEAEAKRIAKLKNLSEEEQKKLEKKRQRKALKQQRIR
ncbi:hypothetical protein PACTADRAFT_35395 [Pachysolen tannophilus NRRL Y-2460]|uniref:Uncharacterized protein n=1 Tax=Pachysolen tannophilus NRRL Y-2460 TaxID=669874 RepID=A0A1E4TPE6_PACTA|nr:hypothetical protein PACTADRAFT_35395 [Pachysolen tannophilus NRRL Y-2460]